MDFVNRFRKERDDAKFFFALYCISANSYEHIFNNIRSELSQKSGRRELCDILTRHGDTNLKLGLVDCTSTEADESSLRYNIEMVKKIDGFSFEYINETLILGVPQPLCGVIYRDNKSVPIHVILNQNEVKNRSIGNTTIFSAPDERILLPDRCKVYES